MIARPPWVLRGKGPSNGCRSRLTVLNDHPPTMLDLHAI
jgi:hypothetical protein